MSKTKRKVTTAQFELFKKECLKWRDFFGLKDWELYFDHRALKNICGQVVYNAVGCVATISLTTNWDELGVCDDESVCRAAFHEICEILLCRLELMAEQRWNLAELDVREEAHRIIRTLENSVFEMVKGSP